MVMVKIFTIWLRLFWDFVPGHDYKIILATDAPQFSLFDLGQLDVLTVENLDFGHGHGQNFWQFDHKNFEIFDMVMVFAHDHDTLM